jgi:sulfite exporter TauE/SafE
LLIGIAGRQLWISGLQQAVSLLSGLLIIMAGLTRLLKMRFAGGKLSSRLMQPVNKLLSYALRRHSGHFIIGVINGLLPCGFVYLALAGAINTQTPMTAAAYMFWFGAGTFPLMLLATVSSGFAGPVVRRRINRAIPYVMVCLGFWFILRGLNLNIPYLSPPKQTAGVSICH